MAASVGGARGDRGARVARQRADVFRGVFGRFELVWFRSIGGRRRGRGGARAAPQRAPASARGVCVCVWGRGATRSRRARSARRAVDSTTWDPGRSAARGAQGGTPEPPATPPGPAVAGSVREAAATARRRACGPSLPPLGLGGKGAGARALVAGGTWRGAAIAPPPPPSPPSVLHAQEGSGRGGGGASGSERDGQRRARGMRARARALAWRGSAPARVRACGVFAAQPAHVAVRSGSSCAQGWPARTGRSCP